MIILWHKFAASRYFPITMQLFGFVLVYFIFGLSGVQFYILGIGFAKCYDYYKHPETSNIKALFALAVLLLLHAVLTVMRVYDKL